MWHIPVTERRFVNCIEMKDVEVTKIVESIDRCSNLLTNDQQNKLEVDFNSCHAVYK